MYTKRIIFSWLFVIVYQATNAQTYQVFSIDASGQQGTILRIETKEKGKLVKIRHFGEQTRPSTTIQQKYNPQGLLTERIQTFHGETDYDLIQQYTYYDNGQKTGELFGNNRTGKWGSFRYSYDIFGNIDTTFVYQKNGDLTDLRITKYSFDAQQRIVQERRLHQKVGSKKITLKTIISYEYPDDLTVKTTILQPDSTLVSEEVTRKTNFGAIKETLIKLPEFGTLRTVNSFDQQQKLKSTKEFENQTLIQTINYKYYRNGQLHIKTFLYPNGEKRGELYKLLK